MRSFRTLRGFISGREQEEETYFAYKASLRIFGNIHSLQEISARLELEPSHVHRKGEKRVPSSPGFRDDMWSYCPDLPESEPLHKHIDALWTKLKPRKDFLLELKKSCQVDVFLGYRSNCDHAGIQVPSESLEMFTQLQIPFGISIIIT